MRQCVTCVKYVTCAAYVTHVTRAHLDVGEAAVQDVGLLERGHVGPDGWIVEVFEVFGRVAFGALQVWSVAGLRKVCLSEMYRVIFLTPLADPVSMRPI